MSELSSLGSKIERLGNILRNTASDQIKDYQQRFSSMAGLYEQALKELIIDNHNTIAACKTANRFFDKDNPNFVAIDGTEYTKSVFDMIIFCAGAYSCEGSISFSRLYHLILIRILFEQKSLRTNNFHEVPLSRNFFLVR